MYRKNIKLDISRYFKDESVTEMARIGPNVSEGYCVVPPHWHTTYEILIIYEGNYRSESCGRVFSGTRPIVLLFCPYTLHSMFVPDTVHYERYIMQFNRSFVTLFSDVDSDFSVLRQINMLCAYPDEAELQELLKLAKDFWHYNELQRDSTVCRLYGAILLRRVLDICQNGSGEIISDSFTYIQDALQYMAEHLSEAPSALTLAEKYGVSKTKFHADFRETTGSSYRSYLTEMRMSCAKSLLTAGASIVECSFETGYSGEASFIAAFRQHFGITPGEFRRTLRKQQKNPAG